MQLFYQEMTKKKIATLTSTICMTDRPRMLCQAVKGNLTEQIGGLCTTENCVCL